MKKLFLHVGIFLVVYILFTGSIFASNISVPFKTFNVGSSGGRITSGNISITYPKNDFVNGTKIILSPVLNQFLPEYVPNIREAFSISIGSDGPLNSQDYTIAHPIKIYVSGAHLSDIYIWDAIRIKWYLLDNLNKSNNIISGESLMRGGTFIVTSAEVSSQFASSSAINPSINNVSKLPIYHGLLSFFIYFVIIVVVIIILWIIFKVKK